MAPFFTRYPVPEMVDSPLLDSFDRRTIPGTTPPRFYDRGKHKGTDIPGEVGRTQVLAGRRGRVEEVGNIFGSALGNQVAIRHWYRGRRWYTFSGHHARVLVHPGQRVAPGTVVAIAGSTGQSSGEHVHFEGRRAKRLFWDFGVVNMHAELEDARRRERRR